MSVEIIDKIKPKNNGTFPLVDASDVEMPDGSRLSDHNFMDVSQLPAAVDDALAKAKASGEFDGKDGTDGKDGKDGKDGYTPVKGIDYFDGAPGPEGPAGSPFRAGTVLTAKTVLTVKPL